MEEDVATGSSVLAWRIPGTEEPGGLPSTGLHRVGHDWSDLAAAAARWGGVPWYGVLVPMEIDSSREPNGPEAKVNFKGPQKPKQGTLTSDRLAKNWTWRRSKVSHKGGGLHMGRTAGDTSCLCSVWQQEIVWLLTHRQIKCHLSKKWALWLSLCSCERWKTFVRKQVLRGSLN